MGANNSVENQVFSRDAETNLVSTYKRIDTLVSHSIQKLIKDVKIRARMMNL